MKWWGNGVPQSNRKTCSNWKLFSQRQVKNDSKQKNKIFSSRFDWNFCCLVHFWWPKKRSRQKNLLIKRFPYKSTKEQLTNSSKWWLVVPSSLWNEYQRRNLSISPNPKMSAFFPMQLLLLLLCCCRCKLCMYACLFKERRIKNPHFLFCYSTHTHMCIVLSTIL